MSDQQDRVMAIRTPLTLVKSLVLYGTVWTFDWNGLGWVLKKTIAANTSVLHIPLLTILNLTGGKGARLVSVDVHWANTINDLTTLTAYVFQGVLPAEGGGLSRNTIAFSYDAGHDTNAERITQTVHKMTLTLDAPVYPAINDDWYIELYIVAPATPDTQLYGVVANYVLRM